MIALPAYADYDPDYESMYWNQEEYDFYMGFYDSYYAQMISWGAPHDAAHTSATQNALNNTKYNEVPVLYGVKTLPKQSDPTLPDTIQEYEALYGINQPSVDEPSVDEGNAGGSGGSTGGNTEGGETMDGLEDFLADGTLVFTEAIGWIGSILDVVTTTPALAVPFYLGLVGTAVKLYSMLRRASH